MASLHNFKHNKKPSFLSAIGQKVKNVAEVIGSAKGLYDVGRSIYTFGKMAAPYIARAAPYIARALV